MTHDEETARIHNLIGRIRHLTPSIRAEGWLTYTRLIDELIDRIEPRIPVDSQEDLSYSSLNSNESGDSQP